MTPTKRIAALALLGGAIAAGPACAAPHAYVASYGSDANVGSGCALASPCRSFTAALGVVDSGGDIVALDAAGYGPVAIDRSVSIIASPGAYAGIAASTGDAVSLVTSNVQVVLRGLSIRGTGAGTGIRTVAGGGTLSIERCVIYGFTAAGVVANGTWRVTMLDSTIRGNGDGIRLSELAALDVAKSNIAGNTGAGLVVTGDISYPRPASATVSDSAIVGNGQGLVAISSTAGATAELTLARSKVAGSASSGILARSTIAGATAIVSLERTQVAENLIGLQVDQTAGTATLQSLGNNTLRQNGTDVSGTVTGVPPS